MTRKDFESIAAAIATLPPGFDEEYLKAGSTCPSMTWRERVAVRFADKIGKLHQRFDRQRFLAACSKKPDVPR